MSQPGHVSPTNSRTDQILALLSTAQSFNPSFWAINVQLCSPVSDLAHRTHVAAAHQAAVCIYLSRVVLSLCPEIKLPRDPESLVTEVIDHISMIDQTDPLFTATAWPAFVAGAETYDHSRQEWAVRHFQELWKVEPWGLIKGALKVLSTIWKSRDAIANGLKVPSREHERAGDNWITKLRASGVDWLIL